MSANSQKALKIAAAVILSIVAAVFVILYLTGQVDDFLGVTGDTSETSSSVAEALPQSVQPAVSSTTSTSSVPQSTPESSANVPQSTPESSANPPQSTPDSAPDNTPDSAPSVPQSTPDITPTVQTTYKFRNRNLLEQHYEKHGREMGFSSAEEYEKAAAAVVNNPDALHKLEKEDGDDVYYVESTNEFVIVSTDGYIRTYFLPDRGIDYYNKQ